MGNPQESIPLYDPQRLYVEYDRKYTIYCIDLEILSYN